MAITNTNSTIVIQNSPAAGDVAAAKQYAEDAQNAASAASFVINVADYDVDPTGVTSSTAGIQAAIDDWRSYIDNSSGTSTAILRFAPNEQTDEAYYLVDGSLDFTRVRGMRNFIDARGATFKCSVLDKNVFDFTHSLYINWTGGLMVGDPAAMPYSAIQVARKYLSDTDENPSSQKHVFQDLVIKGEWSRSCFYNFSAEVVRLENVRLTNENPDMAAYALIQDGQSKFWTPESDFQDMGVETTRQQFTLGSLVNVELMRNNGGPCMFMSACTGHKYTGMLFNSPDSDHIHVYQETDQRKPLTDCIIEGRMEVGGSTSMVKFIGGADHRHTGLSLRTDRLFSTNILSTDTGVDNVNLYDLSLHVESFFDGAASPYSVFETPSDFTEVRGEMTLLNSNHRGTAFEVLSGLDIGDFKGKLTVSDLEEMENRPTGVYELHDMVSDRTPRYIVGDAGGDSYDQRVFDTRNKFSKAEISGSIDSVVVRDYLGYVRSDTTNFPAVVNTVDGSKWVPADTSNIYFEHYGGEVITDTNCTDYWDNIQGWLGEIGKGGTLRLKERNYILANHTVKSDFRVVGTRPTIEKRSGDTQHEMYGGSQLSVRSTAGIYSPWVRNSDLDLLTPARIANNIVYENVGFNAKERNTDVWLSKADGTPITDPIADYEYGVGPMASGLSGFSGTAVLTGDTVSSITIGSGGSGWRLHPTHPYMAKEFALRVEGGGGRGMRAIMRNVVAEDTDISGWTPNNSVIEADNVTVTQDGTASAVHYVRPSSESFTAGEAYLFCFNFKYTDWPIVQISLPSGAFGANATAVINIETDQVISTSGTASVVARVISPTIPGALDGTNADVRIRAIAQSTSAGFPLVYFHDGSGINFNGDGASTFEIEAYEMHGGPITESVVLFGSEGYTSAPTVTAFGGYADPSWLQDPSIDRRSLTYNDVDNLFTLQKVRNFVFKGCVFADANSRGLVESGGFNGIVEDCEFLRVGKEDGAFQAMHSNSYRSHDSTSPDAQDSENCRWINNTTYDLPRMAMIFNPSKGGYLSGLRTMTLDNDYATQEGTIYCNQTHNANGGESIIEHCNFGPNRVVDIAGRMVEAHGSKNLKIIGNRMQGSAQHPIYIAGAHGCRVIGNTFTDCVRGHTYTVGETDTDRTPFGPFSERLGFNEAEAPIAGEYFNVSEQGIIVFGTFDGVKADGNDDLVMSDNVFIDTDDGTDPTVQGPKAIFEIVKAGGPSDSRNVRITGNDVTGVVLDSRRLNFVDDERDEAFDPEMSFWTQGNIGHLSESPQVRTHTVPSADDTYEIEFDCGFRPSLIHIQAIRGTTQFTGTLSYTRATTGGVTHYASGIYDNGSTLVRHDDKFAYLGSENITFTAWKEKGFVVTMTRSGASDDVELMVTCTP